MKTHNITDPGEQKTRDYRWNFDKTKHVFGKPGDIELNGAQKTLNFDSREAAYPQTVFVSKRVEDFRQATNDMLGRAKFRGTVDEKIINNQNFAFGKKSNTGADVWNVGKLLHGEPTQNKLEPDKDLGKINIHKSKLSCQVPNTPDPRRSFGVPTVRTDIPKKTKDSLIERQV